MYLSRPTSKCSAVKFPSSLDSGWKEDCQCVLFKPDLYKAWSSRKRSWVAFAKNKTSFAFILQKTLFFYMVHKILLVAHCLSKGEKVESIERKVKIDWENLNVLWNNHSWQSLQLEIWPGGHLYFKHLDLKQGQGEYWRWTLENIWQYWRIFGALWNNQIPEKLRS